MDSAYLEYCKSDRQREAVQAVIDHGSQGKAAQAMGINQRNIERMISLVRLNAAQRGYSPAHDMTKTCPPTHILKGTSTLYDKYGNLAQQWVKTDRLTQDTQAALQAFADGLRDELPQYVPAVFANRELNADLHNLYVITDYHLGMLSWGEETGEDWDTDIAERTIVDWFAAAIAGSPDSESCTFAQLGDFLHWDGLTAVTPTSGHVLDADTRFQRVVRVAIRVIRQIIRMLLAKHRNVHIIMADANHDPASGVWLREWLAHVYESDSRVSVDNTADTYYCHEFGKTLLLFHHGHKRNPANVDSVFVAKFREKFGRTQYAYAHMGHLHHDRVLESNLMTVEQHRTLAANDAYASRGGWMSGRDAKVITYSRHYGEVGRVTIGAAMLRGGK